MAYVPQKSSWKVEGFSEFERQLRDMATGFRADNIARNTLVKAAKQAMEPVLQYVEQNAPFDETNVGPVHLKYTARLDARIPSGRDKMSHYVKETDAAIAVVSVKKSAVSLAQEFGTSKLAPQPFLRPALESRKQDVVNSLKSTLGGLIIDYARKLARKR